jgi:hypothetical protein
MRNLVKQICDVSRTRLLDVCRGAKQWACRVDQAQLAWHAGKLGSEERSRSETDLTANPEIRESIPTETLRDPVGTSSLRESHVAKPLAKKNTISNDKFTGSPSTPVPSSLYSQHIRVDRCARDCLPTLSEASRMIQLATSAIEWHVERSRTIKHNSTNISSILHFQELFQDLLRYRLFTVFLHMLAVRLFALLDY